MSFISISSMLRTSSARNSSLRLMGSPRLKAVQRKRGAQARQPPDGLAAREYDTIGDAQRALGGENFEIVERAQVDVGRVVPLVRDLGRHRHATEQQRQRVAPVAEVREA